MKDIKSIEFVFENCEAFEVEAKYFAGFQLEDIRTSIARIACNAISKFQTAYSVVIELFKEANVQYDGFGERAYKFNRIVEHHDITSLVIHYSDDTTESYFVDYDEGGKDGLGAPNINQKTYISKLGNLYIVIENGKKIFDFFDKDEINDDDNMDFMKSMILE